MPDPLKSRTRREEVVHILATTLVEVLVRDREQAFGKLTTNEPAEEST